MGLLVFQYARDLRRFAAAADDASVVDAPAPAAPPSDGASPHFGLYVLLSAAIGYVALSQEIVFLNCGGGCNGQEEEKGRQHHGCSYLGTHETHRAACVQGVLGAQFLYPEITSYRKGV